MKSKTYKKVNHQPKVKASNVSFLPKSNMQSIANKKLFKKIGNLFALYLYQTL